MKRPDHFPSSIKQFLLFIKSGIVQLVVITTLFGFLLGAPLEGWPGSTPLLFPSDEPTNILSIVTAYVRSSFYLCLLVTLTGTAFVTSGSAAWNQWQDREMDAQMPRTQNRPLVTGLIGATQAKTMIILLIITGLIILGFAGTIPLGLAVIALLTYNGLYTLIFKRNSAFAAIPGAIPGAIPIWIGESAASGHWTTRGLYLFLVLFFWQMPHFWSLALRYRDDYAKGGVPTLPVVFGVTPTLTHIRLWTYGFIMIPLLCPLFFPVSSWAWGLLWITSAALLIMERSFHRSKQPEADWFRFFMGVNLGLIIYLTIFLIDRLSITYFPHWFVD